MIYIATLQVQLYMGRLRGEKRMVNVYPTLINLELPKRLMSNKHLGTNLSWLYSVLAILVRIWSGEPYYTNGMVTLNKIVEFIVENPLMIVKSSNSLVNLAELIKHNLTSVVGSPCDVPARRRKVEQTWGLL